ncbi:MAG: DUF3732 domain-containing protein [Cyanobacteria bacterium P01_G01_bin.54]
MSIQILDIVLYSVKGERRRLPLNPGQLNIITGDESTGKTALIDIVDYCLGSKKCNVVIGIRKVVTWYALRLTDGSTQHFIARKAPDEGKDSSQEMYYELSSDLKIPEASDISVTSNLTALGEQLKNIVGISNNSNTLKNESQNDSSVTFRQSLFFAFQNQNEIAQRKVLFREQSNQFVAKDIKTVLPYFLGTIDDNYIADLKKLDKSLKLLKKKKEELFKIESSKTRGINEIQLLFSEGRDAGLIPKEEVLYSWESGIDSLQRALQSSPEEQLLRYEAETEQAELVRLSDIHTELRQKLSRQQNDLRDMRILSRSRGGAEREAQEQNSRLSSLQLFEVSDNFRCPLCNQKTNKNLPSPADLETEMYNVKKQLQQVTRQVPGLESLIHHQEEKIEEIRSLLRENRAAIEVVQRADERLRTLKEVASRQAYVLGRISLFLDNLPELFDLSQLKQELTELEAKVSALKENVSGKIVQERLNSILSLMSKDITEWAKALDIEYGGNLFRFDLNSLVLIADTEEDGPIKMNDVGSGTNWLGCHLITHLALHSWFVKKDRPVPHFLFLDQPSQVYYPPDRRSDLREASLSDLESKEREAVIRMFKLIKRVVDQLSPDFQVILTEHADIDEDWYQQTVVEKWRDGEALIPAHWFNSTLD